MNEQGQTGDSSPTFDKTPNQFCLGIKWLFSLSLRQATGMTHSLQSAPLTDLFSTTALRPSGKNIASCHSSSPHHDGFAYAHRKHGHQDAGESEWD
jgi:hypothetical protein